MADDTAKAITDAVSGASQTISALASEFSLAAASWRGVIVLIILAVTFLAYSDKLPWKVPAALPTDNSQVLSAVAKIGKEIAALKASVIQSDGELGKQIEDLKPAIAAPVVPKVRVVKKAPAVAQ